MSQPRAARVLVMVWDGMRPDLVSPELTPNLAALAASGVTFDAHHAIVPTVTRVNAATLATGAPPAAHGLPANVFYAPAVDAQAPISVGEGDNVAQLQAAYGVFAAPTVSDVLGTAGGRTAIVSSGTRGSAQMLHPRRREAGDLIVHPTLSTDDELRPLVERLGPMPPAEVPDTPRNAWLARAIAEHVLPNLRPDLLYFWHDDPDKSQHKFGFGHPLSLQAIRDADAHLGIVLDGLEAAGLRGETLVIVTSDHGYVATSQRLDLRPALAALGADARVVVAPNGCAALLYLERPDQRQTAALARAVRRLPGVEALFSGSRGAPAVDGTLPLALLALDGPLAPDLLVTLAWDDGQNEHGHPGVSFEAGSANLASHGGGSSWEIHNLLIASGPGIAAAARTALPSGVGDLAPTLLTALGLPAPDSMTGRVLSEAFASGIASGREPMEGVRSWEDAAPAGRLSWSEAAGRRYLGSIRR